MGQGLGRMGGKGEGIKKYKLVVTEQPWQCKVPHREQSSQRTNIHDGWTTVWGMPEGVAGELGGGVKGEKIWITVIA